MFEKEIDELYELSKRVLNETRSYATFSLNYIRCTIMINDLRPDAEDGKMYTIYTNDPVLAEISKEEYLNAKAHMLRLLGENE